MASINNMVKKCAGLIDTRDIDEKTNGFLKSVVERTRNGDNTSMLTEAQVGWLEDIYGRHFAG